MGTNLEAENQQLREELAQRDLLIQQLSEELFRLVKGNIAFIPAPQHNLEEYENALQILTDKIAILESQLLEVRRQVQDRETNIVDLKRKVHELNDRQRTLEQTLAAQPAIYRAKFAERMVPIKQKIEHLQKENRQLHMELQSLSFCLASRHIGSAYQLPPVSSASLASRN